MRATALAVLVLAMVPAGAGAAGFGPPTTLAGPDIRVRSVSAAVAPGGQAAVLWLDDRADRWSAAVADRPTALRRAHAIPGADEDVRPIAVGLHRGGLTACWVARPRRASTGVLRCSTARPGAERFGRWRDVVRGLARSSFLRQLVPEIGGGFTALVDDQRDRGATQSAFRIRADGQPAPPQVLSSMEIGTAVRLAPGGDGEMRALIRREPRLVQPPGARGRPSDALRVRARGGEAYRAEVVLDVPTQLGQERVPVLFGRRSLLALSGRAVAVGRRDGTFGPARAVARSPRGFAVQDVDAVERDDGSLLVTSILGRGNRCGIGTVRRRLVATALRGGRLGRAQPLSQDEQVVNRVALTELVGGEALAVWSQGDRRPRSRLLGAFDVGLEVALRPAGGRFGRGTPLAVDVPYFEPWTVANAGREALVAWVSGPLDGAQHVRVSALRRSPPYARPVSRPSRPGPVCDLA